MQPADMQRRQAEIAYFISQAARVTVLRVQYDKNAKCLVISTSTYAAPSMLRQGYAALKAEADRQKNATRASSTIPLRWDESNQFAVFFRFM
jgi:hypothetical protein